MNTDTIADYLTRIRNACLAKHKTVEIPASNIKKEITKILYDQGFILSYKLIDTSNKQGKIKIALKYDNITGQSIIKKINRLSTPGLRKYANAKNLPRILNGLGISIISTSMGVMTGKEAKKKNIGGELICYLY
jgi:small subunit ribosomal protein S8